MPASVYDAEVIAAGTALAAGLIEATGTLPKQGTAVRKPHTHPFFDATTRKNVVDR